MITLNPAWAGFVKGLLTVVAFAVVGFFGDASNLGMLSPAIAALLAGVFAAIESSMKATSDGTKGLFGAVRIK